MTASDVRVDPPFGQTDAIPQPPGNKHDLPLISTIAAAITAAWLLGFLTQWLRLSPIVGCLHLIAHAESAGEDLMIAATPQDMLENMLQLRGEC